ncbi:phage portal protein [Siminovitchia fortis]|uniref:phage portal protein n=1 Tax=Siminovitchia fortis TaxID=254758 RepID=UPI0011A05ACA|nr:phage portal protein [Siminovitchia fortis]
MGFIHWARSLFGNKKEISLKECFFDLGIDYFYKKLAVDTCIDLIANALAQCEIQTFEKGVEKRGENHYLLNVQPNQNQNATEFMHSLVSRLIYENECLVVMQDEKLYVADDFERVEFAFKDNLYKNVVINELKLDKVFHEKDVLYLRLNDKKIMSVIDGMYESLGKLLVSSMNFYKRKNNKRILIIGDFLRAQDEETQAAIDEMFESQLKNWFDPNKEGTAFQMQEGYTFEDKSDSSTAGAGNNNTSRDFAGLVEDVFNYIAMALHVPRGLLKGDVSDIENQIDSFLMFRVNPIAELIQDEFNRKMYTKKEYLERTYLKVDTSKIKIVDLSKFATAADKLFAIGGFTINDILRELGREPIDSDWANYRYVTKNYERADLPRGGESD